MHCLATFHNTLLLNADIILTQNNKVLIKFSVLSCDEDNLNNSVAPPETPFTLEIPTISSTLPSSSPPDVADTVARYG